VLTAARKVIGFALCAPWVTAVLAPLQPAGGGAWAATLPRVAAHGGTDGRRGKQRRGAVAAVYSLRLTMLGSAPLWSSAILS